MVVKICQHIVHKIAFFSHHIWSTEYFVYPTLSKLNTIFMQIENKKIHTLRDNYVYWWMESHCCILLDDNSSSYLRTNMLLANRVKGRKKSEEVGSIHQLKN